MGRSSWEDAPLVTVNPLKLRREAATFGRFAVVGLLGAVIDFSVLNLLIFAAGWASPLQMAAANVVSTSAAILSNFFLNRSWTFRHAVGERRTQFLQFVAVSAVGLVINAVVFFLANHYLFGPLLHTGIAVQLSKAAAIGVGMFWNFIANRLWTFRNRKGSAVMNVSDTPAAPGALPGAASDAEGASAKRGPVSGVLVRRWLLPLGVGLLLLALLNLGLHRRLAPPSATAMPAAEQAAPVDAAPAAETPADAPASTADLAADLAADPAAAPAADPAADSAALTAGAARFAADFSADGGPSNWRLLDGDWQIVDGALVQTLPDGYDRIALYGEPFGEPFTDYVLRVRFKLLAGTGAGILFSTTGPDSKNGGHMVRFTDDGTGLFWGRFSPAGAFESQGYAAAGAPGADWHVLEIAAAKGTYAIRLDGAQVAADVPLLSTGGYIGLTTSQSSAAYAAVEVFDAAQAPPAADAAAIATPPADAALTSSGLEFNTISGDWVQDGALIRQENSKATDFSLGTGVSAENYTLELAVTLPADEALADAGGGILFHMPERNRKEGSQMVRFVDGGKGLTWGSFSADGAFTGEGYVELNLTPGEPQQMALTVRGGVFDVQINGEPVVQDVPTAAQGGWIGLISYRGPVTFEDVKLTLGSVVP